MANIKIENLNYKYPDIDNRALKDINLEIPEGQFVLIVGGSGSGKSSLVRSIAGLIPNFYGGNYSGEIYIDNDELRNIDRRDLAQKVGMVFQDPESQLVMTNVEEEIAFGLENLELSNKLMKRRIMEVTSALSLAEYKNRFIPELSGGQKQKVAMASVLAMQPEILVLDEPTSQLDPIAGEEILTMLRRLNEDNGLTIVLIEQRLERCFHFADRIIVMDNGEIIEDDYDARNIAKWAIKDDKPFIPPLSKLFASVESEEIPVTVKQARMLIDSYDITKENGLLMDFNEKEDNEKVSKEESLVDIKNLWFTYPSGKEVLRDVNLKIKHNSFTVVMGENGGGKTTLLKNINGLLKPSRGHVRVLGKDTKKLLIEELSSVIGYLSQDPNDYLFLPTVKEEVAFTLDKLGLTDEGIVDDILHKLQIDTFRDNNPRDLSTGERQRVALASVLVTKPKLLLLDEPTRGLDYQLKESLGEILLNLKEEGTSIFMIAHDVEFAAEYADEIILIDEGNIIAKGDKYEMLTNSTFYSPQISKLFHNKINNIVTLKQGKNALKKIILDNIDEGVNNE